MVEAGLEYGFTRSGISACCRGELEYAGKSENGEKLVWQYYDKQLQNILYNLINKNKGGILICQIQLKIK